MQKQNYFSEEPYGYHENKIAVFGGVEDPICQQDIFERKSQQLPMMIGNNIFGVHIIKFISKQTQSFGQVNHSVGDLENTHQGVIEQMEINQGLEQESTNLACLEQIQEEKSQSSHDGDETNLKIQTQKTGKISRSKDDNNAHKKITTCLNKCLSTTLRRDIRQNMEKYAIKDEKSQRFWFIFRLLDIQQFSSLEYMMTLKHDFQNEIKKKYSLPKGSKPSQAEIYLNQLIPLYIESFYQFLNDNIEEGTAILYETEDLKQRTYKMKGIQRVQRYLSNILNQNFDALKSN